MNDLSGNNNDVSANGIERGYALDNADTGGADVLRCLADILDEDTREVLRPLGVADGDHCLELGPGLGSMASWLAGLTGTAGAVTAVDLDPRHIRAAPGLTVLRRDLRVEPLPVPGRAWRLVFGRLFFAHMPNRLQLLESAAAALAPGGWLVTADWGGLDQPAVMYRSRYEGAPELFTRYQQALVEHVFTAAGTDMRWYADASLHMRRVGLVNVSAVQRARVWHGGQPGCNLPIHVSRQVQQTLIDKAGFTAAELDHLRHILADDRTMVGGQVMWFTAGQRPALEAGRR